MKLFGFNLSRDKEAVSDATVRMAKHTIALPTAKEKSGKDYIEFGVDNLYPQYLETLKNKSSVHNACIIAKATMIAGRGFEFLGEENLSVEAKARLTALKENPNGTDEDLNDILFQACYSLVSFGAVGLELGKSIDKSRYTRLNNLPACNLRSGKYNENGKIDKYYYSKHWYEVGRGQEKPKEIYTVGNDNERSSGCMYFRKPDSSNEYYGLPDYTSALTWIESDAKMGDVQLNNISNGYAPSLLIKFFKKPDSPEKEDEVIRSLNRQYSQDGNGAKVMAIFSNSREDAPEVTPLEISNLDDQLFTLADQTTQKIITAHRIVSPSILGIPVPTGLSDSGMEKEASVIIFDNLVITPEQIFIERAFKKALHRMGIIVTPKIIKLNPLQDGNS